MELITKNLKSLRISFMKETKMKVLKRSIRKRKRKNILGKMKSKRNRLVDRKISKSSYGVS
jgi:hypothetical protein